MAHFCHTAGKAFLPFAAVLGLSGALSAQLETRGSALVLPEPNSAAVGDFNHDGKLDLAVTSVDSRTGYSTDVQVLLGNGDGTFKAAVSYGVGTRPDSVAAADLNDDGNLDLIVANEMSNSVSILLGNGDGTFQPAMTFATPQDPTFVAVGDFNRDGKLDVVMVSLSDATGFCDCVAVLLGNGDGTFREPAIITTLAEPPTGALGVGRFDADNNLDVAVSEESLSADQVEVLLGNGDGTFRQGGIYPVGAGPGPIAVADFNGDHKADLAVAENEGGAIGILLGNGDGTFQPETFYLTNFPLWVTAADLNGDHKLDLVVANIDFPSGVTTLKGNGDGTFQKGVYYPDGTEDRFVAVGDFNGDHKPDVVVLDFLNGKAIVLLNTGVVSLSPTTPLNFKKQTVGTTSAPQKVTLTNTGTTALNLSAMKAVGQFAMTSTCHATVPAGGKCTISVTFSPKSKGAKSGTVSITDSASSKPQVIELSGTGD
ncbi:MAG: FG-GAP-like repeat-containing protein [Candidatus Sulfotelmatobacter sp.]